MYDNKDYRQSRKVEWQHLRENDEQQNGDKCHLGCPIMLAIKELS